MKKNRIIISIMLVLSLLCVCTAQAFAVEENDVLPEEKISDELKEKMAEAEDDELIPVWIWLKDIDYKQIDQKTETQTGLNNCSLSLEYTPLPSETKRVIEEIADNPDSEYNMDIQEIDSLKKYIISNKSICIREKEVTDRYISVHRKITSEMYMEHNNSIINKLGVSKKSISFKSLASPSFIADLNCDTILNVAKENDVIRIFYHNKREYEPPTSNQNQISMRYDLAQDQFGLTGDGINVLHIDYDFVRSDLDNYAIQYPDNVHNVYYNSSYDPNDPNSEPYDVFDITTTSILPAPSSGHANSCVKILQDYANNASIFSIKYDMYSGIEWAILHTNTHIVSISMNYQTPLDYSQSAVSKWYDYLVRNMNVPVFAAAGNSMTWNQGINAPHVIAPACAYNTIAVGAYKSNDAGLEDDRMPSFRYTPLTNSNLPKYKPDILVASSDTSGGAPKAAAIAAMLLEYKPVLYSTPELIKAIMMSSCHRKIPFQDSTIPSESIESGLTEKQGAGAIDAYRAICTTMLGYYKVNSLDSNTNYKNYSLIPDYKSNYNISLAWLNNSVIATEYPGMPNFSSNWGLPQELTLSLSPTESPTEPANSTNSCKQMKYRKDMERNHVYTIHIEKASSDTGEERFAVAWSTMNNKNKIAFINLLGNSIVGKQLVAETYFRDGNLAPVLMLNYEWLRSSDGQNWQQTGQNTDIYTLTNADAQMYIRCSITTKSDVSISSAYIDTDEKVILYGDADSDGCVSALDAQRVQKYVAQIVMLSPREMIAADVDGDGFVTLSDSTLIQQYLAQIIDHFPVEE